MGENLNYEDIEILGGCIASYIDVWEIKSFYMKIYKT